MHPENRLKNLLRNPIHSFSLGDLIIQKKAKKILIIVNDVTRSTPYEVILPPLLDELQQTGIKKENMLFMVATGIHRSNSQEEIKEIFGVNIFQLINSLIITVDNAYQAVKSGGTIILLV